MSLSGANRVGTTIGSIATSYSIMEDIKADYNLRTSEQDETVVVVSPSQYLLLYIGWVVLNFRRPLEEIEYFKDPMVWNKDPRLNELTLNPLEGFMIQTHDQPLDGLMDLEIHKHS